MKKKKEFVSFLENSHKLIENNKKSSSRQKIIKKEESESNKNIEQYNWDQVTEKVPDITVIDNNGQIEAIEFKCQCGCGAVVQFKYDTSGAEPVLN